LQLLRFKGNPSSTEIEDVVESLNSKMESAPDADGPGVRRSLNNELAVIEGKPGKRSNIFENGKLDRCLKQIHQ
jgi:signal recognition particle subunit SEC65